MGLHPSSLTKYKNKTIISTLYNKLMFLGVTIYNIIALFKSFRIGYSYHEKYGSIVCIVTLYHSFKCGTL